MARLECTSCGFIYAEQEGDLNQGVYPNTPFEELPEDWHFQSATGRWTSSKRTRSKGGPRSADEERLVERWTRLLGSVISTPG